MSRGLPDRDVLVAELDRLLADLRQIEQQLRSDLERQGLDPILARTIHGGPTLLPVLTAQIDAMRLRTRLLEGNR